MREREKKANGRKRFILTKRFLKVENFLMRKCFALFCVERYGIFQAKTKDENLSVTISVRDNEEQFCRRFKRKTH